MGHFVGKRSQERSVVGSGGIRNTPVNFGYFPSLESNPWARVGNPAILTKVCSFCQKLVLSSKI